MPEGGRSFSTFMVLVVFFSLATIITTFVLANSSLGVVSKTIAFGSIIALFIFGCLCLNWIYSRQSRASGLANARPNESSPSLDIGLQALDDAGSFFSGSLRRSDAFRLISNRLHDLVPFESIVLYLVDDARANLLAVEADGTAADKYKGKRASSNADLPGRCFLSRKVEIDPARHFGPSVAIPLCREDAAFGILLLFFDKNYDLTKVEPSLFEAIASRVAPMILSSIAFERNEKNALTDITTDLPNERAFYLVLENQVAEAQRKPEERPLTILAIDIKGFDAINQKFGHTAGDRALKLVAQIIKDNLRQMDFFARSSNDEFLAVLPTATKEISHDITARIHTGFFGRKLKLSDTESIEIELNIGWAAFGGDGETPGQLLSRAKLRKDQIKTSAPPTVLIFPHEQVAK